MRFCRGFLKAGGIRQNRDVDAPDASSRSASKIRTGAQFFPEIDSSGIVAEKWGRAATERNG